MQICNTNLYARLLAIEEEKQEAVLRVNELKEHLAGVSSRLPSGTSPVFTYDTLMEGIEEIDVPQVQRKILAQYENNPFLQSAKAGEQSIEDALGDLLVPYDGFRKFLPHRKNESYNLRVADMSELIPTPTLEMKGVPHDMTNNGHAIGSFVRTTGSSFLVGGIFAYLVRNIVDPKILGLYMPAILSVLQSRMAFIPPEMFREDAVSAREAAQYLDRKIAELL